MPEPLMPLLAELPTAQPDPERAERIKARCRARLARQTLFRPTSSVRIARVWQPLVAALGVAYLIVAIVEAVEVLTFTF